MAGPVYAVLMLIGTFLGLILCYFVYLGLFYVGCLARGTRLPNFFKAAGLVALSLLLGAVAASIVSAFIWLGVMLAIGFNQQAVIDNYHLLRGISLFIAFLNFGIVVMIGGMIYNWGMDTEDGPGIAQVQYGIPLLIGLALFIINWIAVKPPSAIPTIARQDNTSTYAPARGSTMVSPTPAGPMGSTSPPAGFNPGGMSGVPGSTPSGFPTGAQSGFPGATPTGGIPSGTPTGGFPGGAVPPAGFPGGTPTGGFPGGAVPPTGFPGGATPPTGFPGGIPGGLPGRPPGGVPTEAPTGAPGTAPGGLAGSAPGSTGFPAGGTPPTGAGFPVPPNGLPVNPNGEPSGNGSTTSTPAKTRQPAVTLLEKANRSFEDDRASDGFQFLYANVLVEDELREMQWCSRLKQPRIAVHFGIGVAGKGLDGAFFDFGNGGSEADAPVGGGIGGGVGPELPGGFPPMGPSRTGTPPGAVERGAGGTGRGGPPPEVGPQGPGGAGRGAGPGGVGPGPGGIGPFGGPGAEGPRGAGPGGFGPAAGGAAGNPAGNGVPRQEDSAVGIGVKIARHMREKTARAGAGKQNTNPITVLPNDDTPEGLVARAREQGVDALAVLVVTTRLSGLNRQRDTSIVVQFYNVATGEVVGRTKSVSSRQWQVERSKGRDLAAELAAEATAMIDRDWDLTRSPTINGDEARSRAAKIIDLRTQSLQGAAELRYYQAHNLLSAIDTRRNLISLLGEEQAETLMGGTRADKLKVVEAFLPSIE